MIWSDYLDSYKNYLQLEKSLSGNTVEAYLKDIHKFTDYLEKNGFSKSPKDVTQEKIREFIDFINLKSINDRMQVLLIESPF